MIREDQYDLLVDFLRREADADVEVRSKIDEDTSHIYWIGYDEGENAGSIMLARYLVNRFQL